MLHPKNPAGHLEHEWELLSVSLMGYAAGPQVWGTEYRTRSNWNKVGAQAP